MAVLCVFQRERIQLELVAHLLERCGSCFTQRDPDKPMRLVDVLADLICRDIGDFLAVLLGNTADQHGLSPE
jgi:hypothetical protein